MGKVYQVTIPPDLHRRLKAKAEESGMRLKGLVALLLADGLRQFRAPSTRRGERGA